MRGGSDWVPVLMVYGGEAARLPSSPPCCCFGLTLCECVWCAVDMGRYGGAPSLAAIEEEVASGHVTAIVHVRGGAVV